MSAKLCLTVRFLDARFHGRRDSGEAEWPPSPLRLLQALTAVAARRSGRVDAKDRALLEWLEAQQPPVIIAPRSSQGAAVRLAVPNNDRDVIAYDWSRGRTPTKLAAELKTLKTVRPVLIGGEGAVHYVWCLDEEPSAAEREELGGLARGLVALGWGRDLVTGLLQTLGDHQFEQLDGERWLPVATGGHPLRVPVAGTFRDLERRYDEFRASVTPEGVRLPAPLRVFGTQSYRVAAAHPGRPVAAFSLLTVDALGFRPFDPRKSILVAGMLRHAARRAAAGAGWDDDVVNAVVLGHAATLAAGPHVPVGPRRFAYLPLPTFEARPSGGVHVGSIRRVLVTSFGDLADDVFWARRAINGLDLVDEETAAPVAMLALLPSKEPHVSRYTSACSSWATVSPILLPGFDDPGHLRRRSNDAADTVEQRRILAKLTDRTEGLLRKAIVQAGYPGELAEHCELEWRQAGYFAGVALARDYRVPAHLRRFPAVHCVVRWRDRRGQPVNVGGPVCVGAGRFYGIGLFAPY